MSNNPQNKPVTHYEGEVIVGTPSRFKEDTPPVDPNAFKNYREEIYLSLTHKLDDDVHFFARAILDRIAKENLPIDEKLCLKAYQEIKLNFTAVLPESFYKEAHEAENKRLKELEIGAVIREQPSPYGTIRFIILDNIKKDLSNPVIMEKLDFIDRAGCPNPYCNLSGGQFAFKGEDNKYDYYCPKCHLTYHHIEENK